MKLYCPSCDKITEMKIENINEDINVKGEKINITSEVAVCNDCQEQVFSEEHETKNLDLAYSIYRRKHNLLSSQEIINIREKYSLSQRSLASLLEWGEITINRYENGAIQDPAHNEVLNFIVDPKNMKELFEKNGQFLNNIAREQLKNKLEELKSESSKTQFRFCLADYVMASKSIDEFSGFKKFDLEKMLNMILYIAEKTKGVFTTKLNKLLWYIDFLSFKERSVSITGSNYIHLPLGPVPNKYELIAGLAISDGLLLQEEVSFSGGKSGTRYTALVPTNQSLFNNEEMKIMDFIIDHFKSYSAGQIKEKSHKEKAYEETLQGQAISYKYAQFLSVKIRK